jgi:hypothetical protein
LIGGGENFLVDGAAILSNLAANPRTAWIVPALESTTVRQVFHAVTVGGLGVHDMPLVARNDSTGRLSVRVPNVQDDPHSRILPILSSGGSFGTSSADRGAGDTIEGVATPRHIAMVDAFAERVRAAQCVAPRFRLAAGEALLIDNLRVTHGREGFRDLNRLLWRVWCWTDGANQVPEGLRKGKNSRRDFEV